MSTVESTRNTHSGTPNGSHADRDWTTSEVVVDVPVSVGVDDCNATNDTTEPGDMEHSRASPEKRIPLPNRLLIASELSRMADSDTPRFDLSDGGVTVDTLVLGLSEFGLAGLTAVDYLSERLEMTERGHLVASGPPAITPFEDGVPRHHTRLSIDDAGSLGVVISERLVPVQRAEEFADAIEDLCERLSASTLTVLTGVPVAHGPDDHVPFYIATEAHRERYLDGTGIRPMGTGFLDGVPAELLARGIGDDERPVGIFTTPAHPQAPDASAAIRLLDALTDTWDIDVDTGPLETFAATVEAQYRALAERMEATDDATMPDDRMYM